MRTPNCIVFTTAAFLSLSACDRASREAPAFSAERVAYAPMRDEAQAGNSKQARAIVATKLIRTADVRIEVAHADSAAARADSIARRYGGLVTDMRMADDDRRKQTVTLSVSVPAEHFSDALRELRSLGTVKSEGMKQEDVTKEYSDLAIRLAAKSDEVRRLRQLLANRTGKLADVLEVERELNRAITELEQMKGERQYYDSRIAQSSVALTLYEVGVSAPDSKLTIAEAFRSSIAALYASFAGFIYVATFLTPWLVLASTVWWLVRVIRGRGIFGA